LAGLKFSGEAGRPRLPWDEARLLRQERHAPFSSPPEIGQPPPLGDTVLVRTGQTVDILLEVTNPGRWMAHCHIAEHHESGMMFSFEVTK
jgi:FtsP/CotA-like multicopper oxidase with cupredoxin domain